MIPFVNQYAGLVPAYLMNFTPLYMALVRAIYNGSSESKPWMSIRILFGEVCLGTPQQSETQPCYGPHVSDRCTYGRRARPTARIVLSSANRTTSASGAGAVIRLTQRGPHKGSI
jgi:hypothetical protein